MLHRLSLSNNFCSVLYDSIFRDDVINAINRAVDQREEGIVIKDPSSTYKPSKRKGTSYLKIDVPFLTLLEARIFRIETVEGPLSICKTFKGVSSEIICKVLRMFSATSKRLQNGICQQILHNLFKLSSTLESISQIIF